MEQISEEDRKRIRHDATSYFEETFGGNRAEGYVAGASKELLSAQSRESLLKEEHESTLKAWADDRKRMHNAEEELKINRELMHDLGYDGVKSKIQELEQKNKELREALELVYHKGSHSEEKLSDPFGRADFTKEEWKEIEKLLKQ